MSNSGHVLLCVRIPKSGSVSLSRMLSAAAEGHNIFYLPNTLDLDGKVSMFQRLRFARARAKNLWARYKTLSIDQVFRKINGAARAGDVIDGGHIDYRTVAERFVLPLKIVTLLREPGARALSEYNYARHGYFKKSPWMRFDSATQQMLAAKYSFSGYLDALIELGPIYANIASQYLGWDGRQELAVLFAERVFHIGILERPSEFAAGLSAKLGKHLVLPELNRTRTELAQAAILTSEDRRRIERLYPLDLQLFHAANG